MISVAKIAKHYGGTTAVDDVSFDVQPGVVTGFLGPNGAGKTTTMRMILGLDRPTSGVATINNRSYADVPAPMREVGALLDAKAFQTGRTARDHLRWLNRAGNLPSGRVTEVLKMVELSDVADRRVAGYSLGMFQRLGIAAALLGDPETLILDEPSNGLDPAGMRWIRDFMKDMAAQGRTVFVSSHLMGEMQQSTDQVIVINRGRLVADVDVEELTTSAAQVIVLSPRSDELRALLVDHGGKIHQTTSEATVGNESQGMDPAHSALRVAGLSAPRIGELAAANRIPLYELTPEQTDLETAFLALTEQETPGVEASHDRGER